MANQEQIIEAIKEMSVLELNDLVKAIEEEFGVTAAAHEQQLVQLVAETLVQKKLNLTLN